MPAWMTPLLCPVGWKPTARSFSRTRSESPGWRSLSSRETARPTMPAPTIARSHSPAGSRSRFSRPAAAGSVPPVYVYHADPWRPAGLRPVKWGVEPRPGNRSGLGLARRRGLRKAVALAVAAFAAALALAPGAHAAEHQAYAAAMNYATPTITIAKGDKLTFTNLDNLAKHDLVDHDGKFKSNLIGGGQSSPVRGVAALGSGTYNLHWSP